MHRLWHVAAAASGGLSVDRIDDLMGENNGTVQLYMLYYKVISHQYYLDTNVSLYEISIR
jgi:hypothetical protein